MKLQVKLSKIILYSCSWKWEAKNKILIQSIPIVNEIMFEKMLPLRIPFRGFVPSFSVGQSIKLDNVDWYITKIEPCPVSDNKITYIYTLSEVLPETPIYWSTDVEEI